MSSGNFNIRTDIVMKRPIAGYSPLTLYLRSVATLILGGGVGIAVLVFTYHQMGRGPGRDDVAYSLGGGIGCLVTGAILCLAFRPIGALARFGPLLIALSLGTGLTFSTLGVFWWFQRRVFVYSRYPDLNYLLGEVGGYSGPGFGLLTCGLLLIWFYFDSPGKGQRSDSNVDLKATIIAVPQSQRQLLGGLLRLALASTVGAGAGLLSGGMTYIVLLGRRGPTSELAGFIASGLGCLMAGAAFLALCAKTGGSPWLGRVAVALFLLTGLVLCSMGVSKWLT